VLEKPEGAAVGSRAVNMGTIGQQRRYMPRCPNPNS